MECEKKQSDLNDYYLIKSLEAATESISMKYMFFSKFNLVN